MIRSEKQDFSLILKPHLTADIEESARFCHDALTRMHNRVPNRNLKNKLIASFIHSLSGSLLSRLVVRVLTANTFGKGRIHAVSRMGYFLVDSAVLLDFFFHKANLADLGTLARSYSKMDISELVKFVAGSYLQPDVIRARLTSHEFFAAISLEQISEGFKTPAVKKFVTFMCKETGIETPSEMRQVDLVTYIVPNIESYQRYRMEPRDFYISFRELTQGDPQLQDMAKSAILARCPDLAAYVAERMDSSSSVSSSDESAPECRPPYNKRLHSMWSSRDFIIQPTRMTEVENGLDSCDYICLDFHTNMGSFLAHGPFSLITIRFPHKSAFLIPNLFPEVIPSVVRLLRLYARPALTYRWDRFRSGCQKVLGWVPDVIHDVADVTGDDMTPFNSVALSVTGGDFCGRASDFGDSAIPSAVALRHRSMRAAVIYKFVMEGLSLEEARVSVVDRSSRAGKRDRDDDRGNSSRDSHGKRFRYDQRR